MGRQILSGFTTLSPALAAKLVAIVVHADEYLSPDGHEFDRQALQPLLRDPDVQSWVEACGPLAPVKRSAR